MRRNIQLKINLPFSFLFSCSIFSAAVPYFQTLTTTESKIRRLATTVERRHPRRRRRRFPSLNLRRLLANDASESPSIWSGEFSSTLPNFFWICSKDFPAKSNSDFRREFPPTPKRLWRAWPLRTSRVASETGWISSVDLSCREVRRQTKRCWKNVHNGAIVFHSGLTSKYCSKLKKLSKDKHSSLFYRSISVKK